MKKSLWSASPSRTSKQCRGGSLVMVLVLVSSVAVLSLALVATTSAVSKRERATREEINALYVCEAGLAEAVLALETHQPATIGSNKSPRAFGDAGYWVQEADLGGGLTSLVSTGVDDRHGARVELVVRDVTANLFVYGAFGEEGLTMDSNAHVDSYDSGLGDYPSQAVNGGGASIWARENGHVASNDNIQLDQNSAVHGNATSGPSSSVTVNGNATVSGSTAPASNLVTLSAVTVPSLVSAGPLTVASSTTQVLTSGQYRFDDTKLKTGSTLTVQGPATLVLESLYVDSNASFLIDSAGGPVDVYVIDDFILSSNTVMGPINQDPSDLNLYLDSDNVVDPSLNVDLDLVDLNSNAKLYATLYAPNAFIEINSNFELFGSLVARRVHLDSNSKVHFDEQLLNATNQNVRRSYETVIWRMLPFRP